MCYVKHREKKTKKKQKAKQKNKNTNKQKKQSLQKLLYCWIIYRDSASVFIIFKNAWNLLFLRLFLKVNIRGKDLKKASFYTNKSIISLLSSKTMGCYCHPSTHCVVGPAWALRKQKFLKIQGLKTYKIPSKEIFRIRNYIHIISYIL